MARYVISDLHLDHENIIEYCDRPFTDVDEMNRTLIENWNGVVDEDDIVFYLGDLGRFADNQELNEWLTKLTGRIVFIEGNHDHPSRYVDGLNTHQYYILEQGEWEFCCTHRPENAPRFWEGWVIHGHHHNTHPDKYPFVEPVAQRINISAELLDYYPLNLDTLIELLGQERRYGTWMEANDG